MTGADLDRVEGAIVRYLAEHPDAADSAKGIARWWLAGHGQRDCIDEVREALERLRQRGVVTARTLPSGERIYSALRASNGRAH